MADRLYTSIADLREEGVEQRDYSDKRVRNLIRQMSKVIDILTGQWFFPVRERRKLNGEDSPIIYDPSLIPILKVFSVDINYSNSTFHNRVSTLPIPDRAGDPVFPWTRIIGAGDSELEEVEFEIRDRYIEVLDGVWPEGVNNVLVDAFWGWLENLKDVSTTTVAGTDGEIETGKSQVKIASVEGILPKDVARISKNGKEISLLITDIDATNKLLKFDKVIEYMEKVESEATVEVLGRVPELIERACVRLVILNKDEMTSPEFSQAQILGQIKSERTDNYQYTLFTADEGGGGMGGGGSKTTGDALTDRLLQEFTAPLQFRIV